MPDYYTFIKEDDASGISYGFATSTHLYLAVFSIEIYKSYLDNFPTLLTQGYEFSFFRKQHIKRPKKNTHLIKNTIFKIVQSHFEEQGKETVLLYQCDASDGLEKTRALAFDNWYSSEDCYLNKFLVKESLAVVLPQANGSNKTYYIGYIAHKENSGLEDLQKEFNLFAYHLAFFPKN